MGVAWGWGKKEEPPPLFFFFESSKLSLSESKVKQLVCVLLLFGMKNYAKHNRLSVSQTKLKITTALQQDQGGMGS